MERTKQVIVGIFVGGCLLLFGVGLFLIGNSNQLFTKSFNVYAEFSKITGIANGSKVRVGGMDAGTITGIDVPSQPDGKFRIHFRIVEKLHPIVRQDSIATIQTDGLLGNKFLQVNAGSTSAAPAKEDSMIGSVEPFDWGDLMEQISSTVDQVNGVLTDTKVQLADTLEQIQNISKSTNILIKDSTPQVQSILASANRVSENLALIIDGVQQGEGTMGAIFKDEELSASVRRSVGKTEEAVQNLRDTAASAKTIAKDMQESDIVPEIQRTVKNLQQITANVKEAVDNFQSAAGEGGVTEDLQRTLAHAREAMSDLSDNTEALKHNFLFRGFFKKRGFYDLGELTPSAYNKAEFAKGFKQHRKWIDSADLFDKDEKGAERISAKGKERLDVAMTEMMALPRNGPLIIEGYAAGGSASQQYLLGRRRAARVETYVISRFHLRPGYVGVVSMGAEPSKTETGIGSNDGVGIVSYYK